MRERGKKGRRGSESKRAGKRGDGVRDKGYD